MIHFRNRCIISGCRFLIILLSDIDGLYTDDPRKNPNAEFIEQVDLLTEDYMNMGKESTAVMLEQAE